MRRNLARDAAVAKKVKRSGRVAAILSDLKNYREHARDSLETAAFAK